MNGNKIILIVAIVLGAFLLIPIVVYIVHFYDHIISKDPANWGVFGDFFGGILNPIVALLNILVFLYLTRVISQSDEKAHERNLAYQKELILAELRHSVYSDFVSQLDSINELTLTSTFDLNSYTRHSNSISSKVQSMSHLFPALDKYFITVELTNSIEGLGEFLKIATLGFPNDDNKTDRLKEYSLLIGTFYLTKTKFLELLQKEILNFPE